MINKKYVEEYENIEKNYPKFIKRIENQGNWLTVMFSRFIDYIRKLGLENDFIETLTTNEKIVFETLNKIREIPDYNTEL